MQIVRGLSIDRSRMPFWTIGIAIALSLLVFACTGDGNGEDRPGVEVIDGGAGSVSVSASGTGTGTGTGTGSGTGTGTGTGKGSGTGTGASTGTGTSTGTSSGTGTGTGSGTGTGTGTEVVTSGGEHYTPVSNVAPHANLALDMRDIAELLNAAKNGTTVYYAAITDIYENGRHADGRTLKGYATSDSVLAEFPADIDLDANVPAALSGNWAGREVSDLVRRQLLNKSLQAIVYGKVLQEMSSAQSQIELGNLDDASGAPHKVDEGWTFYAGATDESGVRRYSIANTARSRAGNFHLDGTLDPVIQQASADALAASRSGDMDAFEAAVERVRGGLNTIFHLAAVRYTRVATRDTDESARAQHLAEAWAFYQAISPHRARSVRRGRHAGQRPVHPGSGQFGGPGSGQRGP